MSGFSDEIKEQILNAAVGGASFKGPAEGFLALVTVPVVGADTGATITEATYTGYARIAIKTAEWAAAVKGERASNTTKSFAICTALESTVVGWALCTEAAVGKGLVIESGKIPPTLVKAGITPEFLAGALIFRVTDT